MSNLESKLQVKTECLPALTYALYRKLIPAEGYLYIHPWAPVAILIRCAPVHGKDTEQTGEESTER